MTPGPSRKPAHCWRHCGRSNRRSLGKPDPMMLTMALTRSGVSAQDAVFVGDNVLTDGAAAAALNMPFVHIQRSIIQ